MLSLLIFLIITILKADALGPDNENPEIRLSFMLHKEENYTVWKDKPLKIVIENGYASLVWCVNTFLYVDSSLKHEYFVPTTKFSNDNVNILNIKNVTAAMSTRWACTVLEQYHSPDKPYQSRNRQYSKNLLRFNLHVRGARAVILVANNQSLTYVTTSLPLNYDGEANYTYEDGDDFLMDFSCTKPEDNHKKDTLRLEYYNAEGILLFQTKPQAKPPQIFRSVLKSNNDEFYLDCIRASRNLEREYRYRTTFFKRDLHADAVILYVNGQKLSKLLSNDKSHDYIFQYLYGEVLNVTCRKSDVNLTGSLTLHYDKNGSQVIHTMRSPSEAVISLNITTEYIPFEYLICSINNTDVEKPNARLLFLSDLAYHGGVRIRGLPRNNILYQYTNDVKQWTIEYQYSVNDTLNLTCVANGGFLKPSPIIENPFQWKFKGKTEDSAAIGTPSMSIKLSEIPFRKILDATHNGTKIKCIYFSNVDEYSTVEIILRLKPELVSEENEIVSGLVYYLTAAGVTVSIILILIYWSVKNSSCRVRSSPRELPEPRSHPVTRYYENLLAVFQPINEREAMEMENHYEEVQ